MCAASDGTGVTHSVQEFFLVIPGVFPGQLDLDVQGFPIRNTVTPDVGFAVVAHPDDGTVLRIELTYRVVDSVAAVLTEGCDDLVL